ncbi:MAG: sulfatase-like hydrolase/transferase [Clostridia bacterium]|nr:sulfatase-like hydrolase/transferase [Clostridia bacterium]
MKKLNKFQNIVSFTKSKARWIIVFIVLAILIAGLLILMPSFSDERVSSCVGTRGERSGKLYGEPLVQNFIPTGPKINYIDIRFANCDYDAEGTIFFEVHDKDGKTIYSENVNIADLQSDEYRRFNVNLSVKTGEKYDFTVAAAGPKETLTPRLWISNNIPDECGKLTYAGCDPDVRMQVTTEFGYAQFHYLAFFISLGSILLTGFSALLVLNIDHKKRKLIAFIILSVMPAISFVLVELLNANSIANKILAAYFINYIIYFVIYCFFYALTNRLRFAVLFANTIIFIIAVINFYKLEFRGEPVSLLDAVSIKTAFNVAGTYEFKIKYMLIMTACLFLLVTAIVSRFRYQTRHLVSRLVMGVLCAAFGALLVFALFDTDRYSASKNSIMKKLGIVNNVWNQPLNYSDNGMIVAITMNAQYLTVSPPSVYTLDNLQNVEDDIYDNYGTDMFTGAEMSDTQRLKVFSGKLPNIICIMDESYSDFSQFDGFTLSEEYSPYMDSMKENTIKGDCYVSTFGGGTANSEFEFLTGNTMLGMPNGSIPYQQYISSDAGSMARVLKSYGYSTIALHPYIASGWNRPAVYEFMEFDAFYAQEDIAEPEYIRSYISDSCSFKKIYELYEENEAKTNAPLFLFNVTMQNHGSYTKSYANFEPDVSVVEDPGKYTQAEQYFSVARNTDSAVEELITYFSNVDEPTVICFFGDHLPSFKDGFYENFLGVKDIAELGPEEMQKLYITDFFIWANYDIPESDIQVISLNYLSTLVMQVAGLPMTQYQMFLSDMYKHYPVLTTMGVNDKDGNYLGSLNVVNEDLWNYYSVLEYNNVFGKEMRDKNFFDLPYYVVVKENDKKKLESMGLVPTTIGSSGKEEVGVEN